MCRRDSLVMNEKMIFVCRVVENSPGRYHRRQQGRKWANLCDTMGVWLDICPRVGFSFKTIQFTLY